MDVSEDLIVDEPIDVVARCERVWVDRRFVLIHALGEACCYTDVEPTLSVGEDVDVGLRKSWHRP